MLLDEICLHSPGEADLIMFFIINIAIFQGQTMYILAYREHA